MPYRDARSALAALYRIATAQGGYFTAKQVAGAGYAKQHVDYHVKAGNFERVERGLHRLPTLPIDEHDDLIRLSLWSRGRDDVPQAVVSHQSALALHELGDMLPGTVHLTVPPTFRKTPPPECTLHRGRVEPGEEEARPGFRVTTPLRTILDAAASESVPFEQLVAAVRDALDRGLVRRSRLESSAEASDAAAVRLRRALDERDRKE